MMKRYLYGLPSSVLLAILMAANISCQASNNVGKGAPESAVNSQSKGCQDKECPKSKNPNADECDKCKKSGGCDKVKDGDADKDGGSCDKMKAGGAKHSMPESIESYTCPMHPDVLSSRLANCPACGMALVKKQVPSARIMQAMEETDKLNTEGTEYLQKTEYDQALKRFNTVLAKYPTNVGTLYNIACTYSLMGDKEKAVTNLTKAVNNGYNDWKWMEQDTDLTNIRTEPAYQKIIGELKSVSGNQPAGAAGQKHGGCDKMKEGGCDKMKEGGGEKMKEGGKCDHKDGGGCKK